MDQSELSALPAECFRQWGLAEIEYFSKRQDTDTVCLPNAAQHISSSKKKDFAPCDIYLFIADKCDSIKRFWQDFN